MRSRQGAQHIPQILLFSLCVPGANPFWRSEGSGVTRGADYRATHPEKGWCSYYRHRARRFGFEPVVEDFAKADVIELYGDQCWHCKDAPFEELDHHPIPVAAEGPHTIENVKPSCARCNRAGGRAARATREDLLDATI